jgi:NADP-dependent 3-hydroxy acid dehydrogenase YdfG
MLAKALVIVISAWYPSRVELEPGQVAVVTGGAGGLGFALAEAFAARGLGVVLAGVNGDRIADAKRRLEVAGASVLGVPTDVRFADQLEHLAAATFDHFGRVDVLCNNAGVYSSPAPMWEVDENNWRWVMSVNLGGVVNGVRAFVPHLVAQNSGHVVNVASMAGISVGPCHGPYLASKHAIVALSEGLSMELGEAAPNVGVTVVCPGQVITGIHSAVRNRPAELDVEEPELDPAKLQGFVAWMRSVTHEDITAEEAAGIVVDAIERNVLHVAPNGALEAVTAWRDLLAADLDV